jgi:hypothetical protein
LTTEAALRFREKARMKTPVNKPRIFQVLRGDAIEIRQLSFGSVGKLFSGEGVEAVWVKKQNERIDPDWFAQPMVDLLLVVKGGLKMEFESADLASCVLKPGDFVVLPRKTRCRAYRWPRRAKGATLFLAFYPVKPAR